MQREDRSPGNIPTSLSDCARGQTNPGKHSSGPRLRKQSYDFPATYWVSPILPAKLRPPFKLAQARWFLSRSSSSRWQAWPDGVEMQTGLCDKWESILHKCLHLAGWRWGRKGNLGTFPILGDFFPPSLRTLRYINRAACNQVTLQVRMDILKGKFPLKGQGQRDRPDTYHVQQ